VGKGNQARRGRRLAEMGSDPPLIRRDAKTPLASSPHLAESTPGNSDGSREAEIGVFAPKESQEHGQR
jgi:hypothetical protein